MKRTNRSASYPSLALDEALERLQQVRAGLGLSGEHSREMVARAMNYTSLSGSAARAVASLVHYGLLERTKDLYYVSNLGKRYLLPVEDGQDIQVLREAALMPKLFRQVYEEFVGQALPNQLKNILVIKYGIQSNAASSALKALERSFRHAGLLGENGVVIEDDDHKDEAQVSTVAEKVETGGGNEPTVVPQASARVVSPHQQQATNEQGVSLVGSDWSLVVTLKTSGRLRPELRKKVGELLEMANAVGDELYGTEDLANKEKEVNMR